MRFRFLYAANRAVPPSANVILELVVIAVLLALLLLISLEMRIPELQRPYWEDEVHHNFAILRAENLLELRSSIQSQQQPILDYALRKIGWFNLFGHQELDLRLPSLMASLASVAAIFLVTYLRLRRSGGAFVAAAFALSLGSWIAMNPVDIHYATEARHYSVVVLVSVLWAASFVLSKRSLGKWEVTGSVAFLNTHFFSIPLVCTGLALNAMSVRHGKRLNALVAAIGVSALLLAGTVAINFPAFHWLMTAAPGQAEAISWDRFSLALQGGANIWQQFDSYLGLPLPMYAFGAALLLFAAAGIERTKALKLLVLSFVIVPVIFVYFRLRSDYPFGDRYLTPFFGLAFAMLLTVAECSLEAIKRTAKARSWKVFAKLGTGTLIVATLLTFGVPGALSKAANGFEMRLPPTNFSPYFQLYSELRASQQPVFVLTSHGWANDIPLLYLQHVGGEPYNGGYQVANSIGLGTSPSVARQSLRSFLEINPRGLVVLDNKENKERDCSLVVPKSVFGNAKVDKVGQNLCVWTISGAKSTEEVQAVAEATRFPYIEGVF